MKKLLSIVLVCVVAMSFTACVKEQDMHMTYAENVEPETGIAEKGEIKFNFIEMHNYVIEQLSETYNPFFFIKENEFDIDGTDDGDDRSIIITANTIKKTAKQDVDLFISWILLYISENASTQNFRYQSPSKVADHDPDGTTFYTYSDFGTVFNDYDLKIKITREDGVTIYDLTVKRGQKLPFNPSYIREG